MMTIMTTTMMTMRTNDINSNNSFGYHIDSTEKLFHETERTLLAYENMKSLSIGFLKFFVTLSNDLIESASTDNNTRLCEEQANNIERLVLLLDEKSLDEKLESILTWLPLLKSKTSQPMVNLTYRDFYNNLILSMLNQVNQESTSSISSSSSRRSSSISSIRGSTWIHRRQQRAYCIALLAQVHPIFTPEQRNEFKQWSLFFQRMITSHSSDTNGHNDHGHEYYDATSLTSLTPTHSAYIEDDSTRLSKRSSQDFMKRQCDMLTSMLANDDDDDDDDDDDENGSDGNNSDVSDHQQTHANNNNHEGHNSNKEKQEDNEDLVDGAETSSVSAGHQEELIEMNQDNEKGQMMRKTKENQVDEENKLLDAFSTTKDMNSTPSPLTTTMKTTNKSNSLSSSWNKLIDANDDETIMSFKWGLDNSLLNPTNTSMASINLLTEDFLDANYDTRTRYAHEPLKAAISLPIYDYATNDLKSSPFFSYNGGNFSENNSLTSLDFFNEPIDRQTTTSNCYFNPSMCIGSSRQTLKKSDFDIASITTLKKSMENVSNLTANMTTNGSEFSGGGSSSNTDLNLKSMYAWLKHLRLHKYSPMFSQLTYDQVLSLNDEKLMEAKITLGARRKIISNLDKLRNREKRLNELIAQVDTLLATTTNQHQDVENHREVNDTNVMSSILGELYEISLMPIKVPANSLSSLASLAKTRENLMANGSEKFSSATSQFLVVLDKIKDYFKKQQATSTIDTGTTSASVLTTNSSHQFDQLMLVYLKIIDRLFISKGFSDIQHALLANYRTTISNQCSIAKSNRVYSPYQQTSTTKNGMTHAKQFMMQPNSSSAFYAPSSTLPLHKINSLPHTNFNTSPLAETTNDYSFTNAYGFKNGYNNSIINDMNSNNNSNNINNKYNMTSFNTTFNKSRLNQLNAKQRIQNKTYRALEKTASEPFYSF